MRDGTDSRYHCARTNDTSDAARWKQRRTYGSEKVSGMRTDETDGDGVQTRAVHAGKGENRTHAVTPPIWQTTTFSADSSEPFAEIATATRPAELATRIGNPTHTEAAATGVAPEG